MKLLVFGTFDVDNYGDCLFPEILKEKVVSRFGDRVSLELFSPMAKVADIGVYDRVRQIPGTIDGIRHLAKSLKNVCCVLVVGGELLQAGHTPAGMYCYLKPETMSSGLRLWLAPYYLAKELGVPLVYNGLGAAKLTENQKRAVVSVYSEAAQSSLRDTNSRERLSTAEDCDHIRVTTDCAFTLGALKEEKEWKRYANHILAEDIVSSGYLVVQPRLDYLNSEVSVFCRNIAKIAGLLNVPVVLLPICYHHSDAEAVPQLKQLLQNEGVKVFGITEKLKTTSTAAILSCSKGYVGTSLHGTISSLSSAKPVVVLAKQGGKYDGVLREYGLQSVVISEFHKIFDTFVDVINMDLTRVSMDAQNRASKLFDEIFAEIERSEWTYPERFSAIVEQVYEEDISYYRGRPIDRLKRMICTVTRSNPALYALQERISSWKRK